MPRKKVENTNGEDTKVVRPELSKDQKLALFAALYTADDNVKAAEAALEAAVSKRKDSIKTIYDQMGAGPFKTNRLGQVTVVKRDDRYFLRSPKESAEEVL